MKRVCFLAVVVSLFTKPALLLQAEQPKKSQVQKIRKIFFLFHPVCWRMHGATPPKGADPANWKACYERELRVNELQKKFMTKMKSDEALVIFPIGTGKAMRDLEHHAQKTLGRRAIIVRRGGKDPPRAWAKLPNPIERFLSPKPLAGRSQFLAEIPSTVQQELANELRSASKGAPKGWNISVLEVAYYSRMCAGDILAEFKKRRLDFDPKTTKSEAFGEGFEQCAMTWKQMLVPYMGLSHPAENRFDLSVSGAPFLVNAKLVERIKLSHDLRLFLWRGEKGKKLVAMYARAWCRLKDPQLYVRVPLAKMKMEVREVHDKQCWPKADAPELRLKVENGLLRIPIFNGIRRDFDWRKAVQTDEEACYIIAEGISLKSFRQRLVKAKISDK